jgi:hypothetical protein
VIALFEVSSEVELSSIDSKISEYLTIKNEESKLTRELENSFIADSRKKGIEISKIRELKKSETKLRTLIGASAMMKQMIPDLLDSTYESLLMDRVIVEPTLEAIRSSTLPSIIESTSQLLSSHFAAIELLDGIRAFIIL